MGMSSYDMLVDEIIATMQAKGPYAGVERLETLRAEGNSNATTCLGELYLEGAGVIADVEMGIALLQEAASEGNPNACETLGRLYLYGHFGVAENASQGHEYIEKAANEGLPGAMGICACDYFYGRGVALRQVSSGRCAGPSLVTPPRTLFAATLTKPVLAQQETFLWQSSTTGKR